MRRVAYTSVVEHQFELLAKIGKLVLILDGWNELDESSRNRARVDLEELNRDYPNLSIVISSRYTDFEMPIDGPIVEVELLSEEQQLELAKSLRNAEGEVLMDHAWRTPGLRELVAIPLYLTALMKHANEDSLPTTKEEVLKAFVEEQENNRVKIATLRQTLLGFHRKFLECIAVSATQLESVTLPDVQARAAVNEMQKLLNIQGQIAEPIQPTKVLDALVNAHMLVRSGLEAGGYSFQHQQFQEWFAATHVEQLMLLCRQGDEEAVKTIRRAILDLPIWEEAVLFACERMSRESENGREATAWMIIETLGIDPMFSAEMIWRSSTEVWELVGDKVVEFARNWHVSGRVDRALAFMIASGKHEFSEIVWPLFADEAEQNQLHALRAGRILRIGVLGPGLRERIAALPELVRSNIISAIAADGDMEGIELATGLAKSDPSLKVRKSTITSLIFRRADRFAKEILDTSPDEVWASLALSWRSQDFVDPEVSARIQVEIERLREEETDPGKSLHSILSSYAFDPGSVEAVQELVEKINFSRGVDNGWLVHRAFEYYPDEVLAGLVTLLEGGKELPHSAKELLRGSGVLTDDGPLADLVLEHYLDGNNAAIAVVLVGTGTIGKLIEKVVELYPRIRPKNGEYNQSLADEYHTLLNLISNTNVGPFSEAVLERANTVDPDQIYVLCELISRHGVGERDFKQITTETRKLVGAAVQRWGETLLASSEVSRAQFAAIASASTRLGDSELLPVMLKLLSEEQNRRKLEQQAMHEARSLGQQVKNTALMYYTNLYMSAFCAMGDEQTVAAMRPHLRDLDFGVEAALVIRSVWQTSQPQKIESGVFPSWPDFSVVAAAHSNRAAVESGPTHAFVEDIIVVVQALIDGETDEAQYHHALKLAAVAFSMPYANMTKTIDKLLQLPVPVARKQELLTVLVIAGEPISSELVIRGIDELLGEAESKPWVIHEQHGWLLKGWLRLLPFTEKPAAIFQILERVESLKVRPLNLDAFIEALGYSTSIEAETVLGQLAKTDNRFMHKREWLMALERRNTLSAARLLLELICQGSLTDTPGSYRSWDISTMIAGLMLSHKQFRQDVYDGFTSLGNGPAKLILEQAIASKPDPVGILLMIRQAAAAKRSIGPTGLMSALREVLITRTPMGSYGVQELSGLPAAELRKALFDLMVNGSEEESRLSADCLREVDEIRDDYGQVDSDPRHPDIATGIPWPNLDLVAPDG